MLSKGNIILVVLLLLSAITACSQSPAEKALKELRQRHIDYSEESFIEYVEKGDKSFVDLFLTAGMSPDAKSKEGISALTIAARGGHTEIVTLLLAKGVDVNAKDKDGYTTLSIAATNARAEIVALLLAKGADVNAKDNEGWTALMEAARLGNIDVVKILIDKGADVSAKNNAGRTALMIAKNKTRHDIVDILEKAGATIPKESIEGLLTIADSQWQKGDYQNAIQGYEDILSLDPNNSKAKEFLKKYSAVELTIDDIEKIFKEPQGLNGFERKKRAEEQREFLSKNETYSSILRLDFDFAISEYDFKRQRFNVTVGLRPGEVIGPAFEGYSGMIVPETLFIVNENGRRIDLPLYMDEEKAASLKSQDKKDQKIFIIYKLRKVEKFTDALGTTRSRANPYGGAIIIDRFRRYIKPLYVALLTGNEKYVLYEEKESEIKSKSTTKIKPIEKRMKRK